ncbi:MAG TPA: hypothetical protein VI462_03495 [Acidimicrobiia bacterium]
MSKVTPRSVVAALGICRVGIGLAFLLAPRRLNADAGEAGGSTLMVRSFAVREAVLGIGGLLVAMRAENQPTDVQFWAGLGALVDTGDLGTAVVSKQAIPSLMATVGLAAESWAWWAAGESSRSGDGAK